MSDPINGIPRAWQDMANQGFAVQNGQFDYSQLISGFSGIANPGAATRSAPPRGPAPTLSFTSNHQGQQDAAIAAATTPAPGTPAPSVSTPAQALTQKPRLASAPGVEDADHIIVPDNAQFRRANGTQASFGEIRSEIEAAEPDVGRRNARLQSELGVVPTVDATGRQNGFAIHNSRMTAESRSVVDGLRSAGNVPGADMALRNGGFDFAALGGGQNLRGMGTAAMGLGALSIGSALTGAAEGMQFQLRKQMRSVASNFGDSNMIAMINSPGISIESLIYYFMAYMSDKYEDKLREKMEEVVIQEQRERRMQQRREAAEMIGGILSIGGVFNPAGQVASMGVKAFGEFVNGVDGALSGSSKSTTVLMQEVQILIQNWKMIMDMTSNVSKTLHEMAMTAVRNIR